VLVLSVIVLLIWVYLLLFHGRFWQVRRFPEPVPKPTQQRRIAAIIPARNEADVIGRAVSSLINQNLDALFVVDDNSGDGTANAALAAAHRAGFSDKLTVIRGTELPPGWTGKNHAMYTGYLASSEETDYLLFVDADTRHAPDMLSTVVLRARDADTDLLSLVIDLEMRSFWERLIVPQVGELYTLLVGTMDSVNSPGGAAAANGQFLLMRRDLYAQIGALDTVRSNVAEDRAIAIAAKARGHQIRLEYGSRLVRACPYSSLREMWAGYSKTLFWATGRNTWKALAVALALALYALVPPTALAHALLHRNFSGRQSALRNAPFQLVPMLVLRMAICRRLGIPAAYAFVYPLAVALGDAMLLFSLYRVLSGRGVGWKGRTYI